MLNDITLSADGLSPSWRLTDEVGNSLTGYGWSSAGVSGVGGGSQKYRINYTPPAGSTQWGIEGRDNLGGAIASATINLAPTPVTVQSSSSPAIIIQSSGA